MKKIWNHNFAYHNWIYKNITKDSTILDVGCGDGTLAFNLANNNKKILGIDINHNSITTANKKNIYNNVEFIKNDYLTYDFKKQKFDVIIFVAAIQHMDMKNALDKAKLLLNDNGKIIIVGLSNPSNLLDYIIEILRIIPSFIISKIMNSKTSEKLNIDTCYEFPKMNEIRKICKDALKNNYKIKYGLHYRYLLIWNKKRI